MKKILLIVLLSLGLLSGCSSKEDSSDFESQKPEIEHEDVVYPEVEYNSKYTTYQYSNENNISVDDYDFSNGNIYSKYDWDKTYFESSVSQNTIFMYEHVLMLPETKEYELFIRGRGDIRVFIGDSFDTLELASSCYFDELSSYDYYNISTVIKIQNIEGKPICIRVVVGTNVRGAFYIGMTNSIGVIQNIPNDYLAILKEGDSE